MSRPLEETRTDVVRTLIARLSLRRKLYLVMALGLLAVVTPSLVAPLLAERDESSLRRIEGELVPAAEASREMMRTLERAHEGVQLASVAADPSALRAFDATRHEALEHLETLKRAEPPIAPSLASAVEAYVRKAQGAIERSLAGSTRTGELTATLEAFDRLRPRVARQIEVRRTMLARGFATASITRVRGQRASMIGGFVLLLWDPLESTCRHASLSIL